jgi:hypothetical protein
MDILSLRIALETLLADFVGTYRLANGTQTPAVHVRAVGEPMTAGTTVQGMEMVLVRDPELDPIRQYKAPKAFRRWQVYLIAWDDTADLEGAAALILGSYPSATISTITVPEQVGPQNQMLIEIQTGP